MSPEEFYSIMPILLLSIGIGDILLHWKDYFQEDRRYWPHIVTGFMIVEVGIRNYYLLFSDLPEISHLRYNGFLVRLIPPMFFLLSAAAFTPDENSDVKEYFIRRMPLVFSLLALFIASHWLIQFKIDYTFWVRVSAVAGCLLMVFTRKPNLIYLLLALRVWIGFTDFLGWGI